MYSKCDEEAAANHKFKQSNCYIYNSTSNSCLVCNPGYRLTSLKSCEKLTLSVCTDFEPPYNISFNTGANATDKLNSMNSYIVFKSF